MTGGAQRWKNFCRLEDSFASSVLGNLITTSHLGDQKPQLALIESALRKLKDDGGSLPTLCVEINERCSGVDFERLLLLLKCWGVDQGLVRCVVVSSSHTAMNVTIGFDELHAQCITIDDLTVDEA